MQQFTIVKLLWFFKKEKNILKIHGQKTLEIIHSNQFFSYIVKLRLSWVIEHIISRLMIIISVCKLIVQGCVL